MTRRPANPVAPVLPSNPVPDRVVERVAALEDAAPSYELPPDVGADGQVLKADGGAVVWGTDETAA